MELFQFAECKPKPADNLDGLAEHESIVADKSEFTDKSRAAGKVELADGSRAAGKVGVIKCKPRPAGNIFT